MTASNALQAESLSRQGLDLLAHTAFSVSLQHAGQVPQAEAAGARARVIEWKIQFQSPPASDNQL